MSDGIKEKKNACFLVFVLQIFEVIYESDCFWASSIFFRWKFGFLRLVLIWIKAILLWISVIGCGFGSWAFGVLLFLWIFYLICRNIFVYYTLWISFAGFFLENFLCCVYYDCVVFLSLTYTCYFVESYYLVSTVML